MASNDEALSLNLGFPSTTTPTPEKPRKPNVDFSQPSLKLTLSTNTPTGTASEEGNSYRLASVSDEDDELATHNNINVRKKLRLTKHQSALLEDCFNKHTTLNPKQKQALANQLNLRPRQVEVWFQNRRARTKLKKTEVDCEFLRKWYETLTEENRRLQKEVEELRALKLPAQQFHMQLPAAALTMCPSCERIGAAAPTAYSGAGAVANHKRALWSTITSG